MFQSLHPEKPLCWVCAPLDGPEELHPPPPLSGMLQMYGTNKLRRETPFPGDCCHSPPAYYCCWLMDCDLQISSYNIRNIPPWSLFTICLMNVHLHNDARRIMHLFIMWIVLSITFIYAHAQSHTDVFLWDTKLWDRIFHPVPLWCSFCMVTQPK